MAKQIKPDPQSDPMQNPIAAAAIWTTAQQTAQASQPMDDPLLNLANQIMFKMIWASAHRQTSVLN
jgi:hypothetical protein